MQMTMCVVLFAHNAWIWLISITGVASLPPYLANTAFLWLYASKPGYQASGSETRDIAIGLPVFWYARRERAPDKAAFTRLELAAAVALVIAATVAATLFAKGIINIT